MRNSALLYGIAVAAVLVAIPATISLRGPPTIGWSTAQAAVDVDINLFFTSLAPHGAWIPSTEYNYIWVPTSSTRMVALQQRPLGLHRPLRLVLRLRRAVCLDRLPLRPLGLRPADRLVLGAGNRNLPARGSLGGRATRHRLGAVAAAGPGYATTLTVSISIGAVPQHYWRMVPANQFLAPQLRTVAFAGNVRTDLFLATQPAGVVIVQNNIVVNNVINITFVEQQTKQKVAVAKVETVTDPQEASGAQAANATSLKAFTADLAEPDKSVAPAKVVAKADVQAPTKGQALAPAIAEQKPGPALGALPNAPAQNQPGTLNPRCAEPAFAKDNPKDCPAPPATAAVTPSAGGAPIGNAGAPAPATGTAAGPGERQPGQPALPRRHVRQGEPEGLRSAGQCRRHLPRPPRRLWAMRQRPPVPGPAAVQGNVNPGNARCADATFARNNPRTCSTNANAAGRPTAPGAPAAIVPPPAGAAASVSVQGNAALADPRCVNLTFANANPKVCVVGGNAAANPAIVEPQPAQR